MKPRFNLSTWRHPLPPEPVRTCYTLWQTAAAKARAKEQRIGSRWCNIPDECIRLLLLFLLLVQAEGQAAWAHSSLGEKKSWRGHLSFLSSLLTNEMGLRPFLFLFFNNTWENKSTALLKDIYVFIFFGFFGLVRLISKAAEGNICVSLAKWCIKRCLLYAPVPL